MPRTQLRWLALLPAAMVVITTVPAIYLIFSLGGWDLSAAPLHWGLLGLVLLLPLDVTLVIRSARGAGRDRTAYLLLAAIALVCVGFTPLVGVGWTLVWPSLFLAIALVLPPTAGAVGFVVLASGILIAPRVSDTGAEPGITVLALVWLTRMLPFLALVWLVLDTRLLAVTHDHLRRRAVEVERRRVGEQLRRRLGVELDDLAARAEAILEAPEGDRAAKLRAVVADARDLSQEARRVTRDYRRTTSHGELDTAVTLLRAAGVEVTVSAELPDDPQAASELGAIVQRLLATPGGPARLVIGSDGARVTFEVAADVLVDGTSR